MSKLHKGLTFQEYQSLIGVNSSTLKQLLKSPEHFRASKDYPSLPSTAQEIGSALHCKVLQPELFNSLYVEMPSIDRRTKIGKEEYQKFIEGNANKVCLSESDYKTVDKTSKSFDYDHNFQKLYKTKHLVEQAVEFKYRGVDCKAQLDLVCKSSDAYALADIKTTRNFFGFKREIKKYDYIFQLAFYTLAMRAVDMPPIKHYLIAVEKSYPYKLATWIIPSEAIEAKIKQVDTLLDEYKSRTETDNWKSDLVFEYEE